MVDFINVCVISENVEGQIFLLTAYVGENLAAECPAGVRQ